MERRGASLGSFLVVELSQTGVSHWGLLRRGATMSFGVFLHKPDSIYDDILATQYQFPKRWLKRVKECFGSWIVYNEPTKVKHTRGYFAIAKLAEIRPDPNKEGMYLGIMEPGSYLDFARCVPFRNKDGVLERGLLDELGKTTLRARDSVRSISPEDFDRILEIGLDEGESVLPREQESKPKGVGDAHVPFSYEPSQIRMMRLSSRKERDGFFRKLVLNAYDERCAVTGLKLINGGGRAEVEAAHIKPVTENGPDMLSNGIALSGTAHWMFDRGLISLADDMKILISSKVNDVDSIKSIINTTGQALVPALPTNRPHPHFLNWHRENCFKH
jgi:putative restriction endonuclease